MGRKPNPIIHEYFERGAKLDDASNRYHHTCKKCGEEFPKGRIDSLNNHLTKKCIALSLTERTQIVLRLHDLTSDETPPKNASGAKPRKGETLDLPYSPSRPQNFDGLNVLAEASTRVGATDNPRGFNPNGTDGQTPPVDPALQADDFPAGFLNTPDEAFGFRANAPSGSGSALALPSIFSYMPQPSEASQDDSGSLVGLGASLPEHLSSIAASANDMMPVDSDIDMSNDNIATTLFNQLGNFNGMMNGQEGTQTRPSITWQTPGQDQAGDQDMQPTQDGEESHNAGSQPSESRMINGPRAIAMNPKSRPAHYVLETGTAEKTQRPKARGKFTADRRKEVQKNRQLGACTRCRMLKKPCSAETPCASCRNVDSARVWKGNEGTSSICLRARLADEFTLFSAGLQSTLAWHDLTNIKASIKFEPSAGRIEAFHFEENAPVLTVSFIHGQTTSQALVQGLALENPIHQITASTDIVMLDSEGDTISKKMSQYVREMIPTFLAREASPFVHTAVSFASKLSHEKEDDLLFKVTELWASINLLTDLDLTWKATINASEAPMSANHPLLHASTISSPSHGHTLINEATNPYSYSLVCSQLRSAAEKRAGKLSAITMKDIERRLLQRQTNGRFETFLGAIIFLNCVERLCWLVSTWQVDEARRNTPWPLEKGPQQYVEEGDRLADFMNMILRMRVSPKTSPRVDNGVLMPIDDSIGLATQWFTAIQIDQSFLNERNAAQFDAKNSRSMDGKFFARVLQPEKCHT